MRRRLPASIVALVSAYPVVGASGCSTDSGVNAQTLESTGPATAVSLTAQSLPAPASSPVPVSSPPASTTAAAMTAALAIACVLLAGCNSASGVNIETLDPATASSTASASPSQSSAPPSSVLTSPTSPTAGTDSGLPAGEAADRAAVEAQWTQFWDVYIAIAITPAADREALVATVAVDPTKANMLSDAAEFDSQGLRTYGTLGHRISWPQPINGAPTAVIDDCQDASQTGAVNTTTGNKVTVGVPRDHYQGSLVKGDDGVWRVAQAFYLKDEPC
jgi:hypothetical protein